MTPPTPIWWRLFLTGWLALLVISFAGLTDAYYAQKLGRREFSLQEVLIPARKPMHGVVVVSKPSGQAFTPVTPVPKPLPSNEDVAAMAEAIYHEANHRDKNDSWWIAHVIINRVNHREYPNSVIDVINQGVERGLLECQFTYKCDGKPEVINDKALYEKYRELAMSVISDELQGVRVDPTGGALNYHNPRFKYNSDGSVVANLNTPAWAAAGNCILTVESTSHRYFAPLKEGRLC